MNAHALSFRTCTVSTRLPRQEGSARGLCAPTRRAATVKTRAFFGGLFGGGDKGKGEPPKKAGGMKPVAGNCATCKNKGAVQCKGCKGTGRNKNNGNIMERYKCYDCQGFGLVACKACGRGGRGLTPEQTGER